VQYRKNIKRVAAGNYQRYKWMKFSTKRYLKPHMQRHEGVCLRWMSKAFLYSIGIETSSASSLWLQTIQLFPMQCDVYK